MNSFPSWLTPSLQTHLTSSLKHPGFFLWLPGSTKGLCSYHTAAQSWASSLARARPDIDLSVTWNSFPDVKAKWNICLVTMGTFFSFLWKLDHLAVLMSELHKGNLDWRKWKFSLRRSVSQRCSFSLNTATYFTYFFLFCSKIHTLKKYYTLQAILFIRHVPLREMYPSMNVTFSLFTFNTVLGESMPLQLLAI